MTASDLDKQAVAILRLNDKGKYTVPTEGLYPYQWNWDSAFAAIGFAQFDIDRAWVELESLLGGQWDNGMVPHILFHENNDAYFPGPDVWGCMPSQSSSGISQPPIAATMARKIFDKNPEIGQERLAAVYDSLLRWHRWFMDWRLDRGAVCVTHPWEAGRDNAVDWDGAMAAIDPVGVGTYTRRDTRHVDGDMRPTKHDYDRYIWLVNLGRKLNWDDAAMLKENPFRVADPTMTFTLLRAQRDMLALGHELGRDVQEIEDAILVLEAGAETLWNDTLGAYDARDTRSGAWSGSLSNASFLSWYAGLDVRDMHSAYAKVMRQVKYGVPSLDPANTEFDVKRYWRGPVWGVMNMLIGIGLVDMGLLEAESLRACTAELISAHGFSEYYNPLDGSPAGGQSFTWTAAVWLAWASPNAGVI